MTGRPPFRQLTDGLMLDGLNLGGLNVDAWIKT
jgi:hypothetical protein